MKTILVCDEASYNMMAWRYIFEPSIVVMSVDDVKKMAIDKQFEETTKKLKELGSSFDKLSQAMIELKTAEASVLVSTKGGGNYTKPNDWRNKFNYKKKR